MKPLVFAMPGNEYLGNRIAAGTGGKLAKHAFHDFPDGETYLRVEENVEGREIIVVCTLHHPNEKLIPLYFLCRHLRSRNVRNICLVAPYLAYMRQDKAFRPGEAVTSVHFAELISTMIDRLVTVDPHLHRWHALDEIYPIRCDLLHASAAIAEWIRGHVPDGVILGPDSESAQWVGEVARMAGTACMVLEKTRLSDTVVKVSVPNFEQYKSFRPILVDDIVATAHTMIETVNHLAAAGAMPPVCIGIHAVFAGEAYEDLLRAGAAKVVTSNTIPHPSNGIDLSPWIVEAVQGK